jgi:glycosyltransferase involved in cell wall biosynthesis
MTLKISIITAVFNRAATIAECLDSVMGQSHPAEQIIADGGSTDGTLEIVERYRERGVRIVSGADNGIYDAMNKGLALATGDVVGFLNADDFYAGPEVLAHVSAALTDRSIASCYGDLVYVDPRDTSRVIRYWRSGPYDRRRFFAGWMPPHPTFFVRREIFAAHGTFDPALGSAADYELMLRFLVKQRISSVYIPEILVRMRAGGVSNASLMNRLRANRMDRRAWEVNGLRPRPWTLFMKPLSKIPQYFRKP